MSEEKYATRIELDIEGNPREVIDAKDRIVMRYDYDMLCARIHQASMEAGETLDAERSCGAANLCLGQPGSSLPHGVRCAASADRILSA